MLSKKVVWVAVVIVVAIAGLYFTIASPFTSHELKVNLSVVASGNHSFSAKGETYVSPYVNLTIRFTSPSVLDPSKLNLTITGPGGRIAFGGSGTVLSGIRIAYYENMNPHWLATCCGGGMWSGYTATVINPDRSVVGGTLTSSGSQDETIESGANMTLTFPSNVNSARGYVLTASYQGTSGTASITLP